jgi:uncharacterized membrane protein
MTAVLEERIEALERDLTELRERVLQLDDETAGYARVRRRRPVEERVYELGPLSTELEPAPPRPARPTIPTPRLPSRSWNLEELLGGRLLALAGGIAILLGAVFFVGLAIDRGWIGETARVVLAFIGSSALLAAGVWLYERRGRTQAALCAVGAAIASLYLSLVAATALYDLLPAALSLPMAFVVGALATALAVRWDSRTVAALGIVGALLAPLFTGASDGTGALFLVVAYASAAAVCVWRQWEWLAVTAFLCAMGQVAVWLLDAASTPAYLATLAALGALTLAAAMGYELRVRAERLNASSAFLCCASALTVGSLGALVLPHGDGEAAGGLWIAGVAGIHAVLGFAALGSRRIARPIAFVLFGVALAAANVAFGLLADGPILAAGWAASAFALAFAARRVNLDRDLLRIGLGGQLALAIGQTLLFEAPPGSLVSGDLPLPSALAALGAVAASAFGCARVAFDDRPRLALALDCVALVALAYLTALALDGLQLALAWAGLAALLDRVEDRTNALAARIGTLGFLVLAALHALVVEAPAAALLHGANDLGAAAAALGAVALVAARRARSLRDEEHPLERTALIAGAALSVLYLASIAIVSAFDPNAGSLTGAFELGLRQEAQVALSAFWGVCGLLGLWVGLHRCQAMLRRGAFALLVLALAKVFFFDLAALGSVWRVLSFVGLGLLLLLAALAYQRLRPPVEPTQT